MSYQVIARKYRPQRFSDVVGQDHVTTTLSNAIQQNRIAHAYLFVGPRGTGKTTLARIFAKCLNCTGGPKVDFSDDDPRCREIAEGRSLDVLEIDGASNRGIEEVRELRETVKYAPAASRFKIYIIDEVHMLTKEAFNALLKTLEEPPPHVKFMFATTEAEKVLPTILSRCQRFDLRRIPSALIVDHLTHIAAQEKVQVEEAALRAIARGADGGMRDAQSALDQLISFCGEKIVEADVLSMFGLAGRDQVLSLAHAVLAGDAHAALHELDSLAKTGKDLSRLLSDLLNHFRNLLLFQVSRGDLTLLDISETEGAALAEQSRSVTTEALTRMMDLLSEFEGRLRDAASRRILIEVALLRAIQARSAASIETVLQKLQALRNESPSREPAGSSPGHPPRTEAPVPPKTAPASAPPLASPAPAVSATRAAAPAAEDLSPPSMQAGSAPAVAWQGQELGELWGRVLESVGNTSRFLRSYLLEAHPVSLSNTVLVIGFSPECADHLGLVDNAKNHKLLEGKLQELGLPGVQVKFIQAQAPEGWVAPAVADSPEPVPSAPPVARPAAEVKAAKPAAASKEEFKNDPLIKQALELFKGRIVEART